MAPNIRLSPKYGVNPSLGLCWLCGEENGEIVLPGRLKPLPDRPDDHDPEAPHRAVWDRNPCDRCAALQREGVFLLEVRDGSQADPDRTGRLWVLRDEAVRRIFNGAVAEDALRRRVAWLEESAARALGLEVQP